MKTKAKLEYENLPKDYATLCRFLLPRPIRDAVDYANVTEMTDAMVLWQDSFTSDQSDYFEMLTTLIEEFDKANVNWPKLKGRNNLQHLLNESGLSAADLSRILGVSRNLGAMILRGERHLTLAHIRKISEYFKVSAELFI